MTKGDLRPFAAVEFGSAGAADRRVAGVSAPGRVVRELATAGYAEAWIDLPPGQRLAAATQADLARLADAMAVRAGPPPGGAAIDRFPGTWLIAAADIPGFLAGKACPFVRLDGASAGAEILRGTGKTNDGIVSRWLNRPISQRLSALFLRAPGMRPIHATVGTALIAMAMFAALIGGGRWGLIAGALLFHAASVFDGVDGEIARATFRTSRQGAALDSAIDMATNVAAMLGLAINLALAGQPEALALVGWALAWFLLGMALIGWRSLRRSGTLTFDGVKDAYNERITGPLAARAMNLAKLGTSRDFCAVVYLVLVLAGIPIAGLYLFAVVTPVWFLFVAGALWPTRGTMPSAQEAAR